MITAPRPHLRRRPTLPRRRMALAWTVIAVVFGAWLMLLRPTVLGGPTSYLVVNGHSMLPHLPDGDMVVVRAGQDYRVGDVVAYRVPGGMVIHRIIGGDPVHGFTTKGDNNQFVDPWHPRQADVVGRLQFAATWLGPVVVFLRQPLHLAGILAALFFLLTVVGGDRPRPSPGPMVTGAPSQEAGAAS